MRKSYFALAVLVLLPLLVWSEGTLDVSLGYTIPSDHNISIDNNGSTVDFDFDAGPE